MRILNVGRIGGEENCNEDFAVKGVVNGAAEFALCRLLADAGINMSAEEDADIIVRDPSFYRDVLTKGSMGLGDSYVEGKWDSDRIDEVIYGILRSGVYQKLGPLYNIVRLVKSRIVNLQDRERSREVIDKHYDLPASFYAEFLDPYFQYTCARFEGTADLDEAQRIKMDNICKKLGLKPGDKVMDVGGGWGGQANFMAENYGVQPTVVTRSGEQARYIQQTYGDKVKVELCDYREIPDHYKGSFDAISAIGVLEHVGHKNYDEFFRVLADNLKPGGRALVHSLYTPYDSIASNPWVDKYIFPNGEIAPLPMIKSAILSHLEPVADSGYPTFEELTPNYPPTLHAWKERLTQARQSGKIKMSEQEYRKWMYYFMSYAGAIKAGHVRVGQFLCRKAGKTGGRH